jgi:hypothetical protein
LSWNADNEISFSSGPPQASQVVSGGAVKD